MVGGKVRERVSANLNPNPNPKPNPNPNLVGEQAEAVEGGPADARLRRGGARGDELHERAQVRQELGAAVVAHLRDGEGQGSGNPRVRVTLWFG